MTPLQDAVIAALAMGERLATHIASLQEGTTLTPVLQDRCRRDAAHLQRVKEELWTRLTIGPERQKEKP